VIRLYEVWVGQEVWSAGREEAFQDEDGGDLVDEVLTVDTVFTAGTVPEKGVGVVCGQALVEEMVGECGVCFAKSVGKGDGFDGLRAGCAVGVERVADDDDLDIVLADEPGDGFKVGSRGGSVESEERLRSEA
jgi:hypothetical protein